MRKPHLLLLLGLLLLVVACRQVLPEDRMVDLLTDMYLYDEEFAKGIQGADSVSFYRSVFIKHGCGEEEYKKAVAWYAKKPKVMKEIYTAVKTRLEGYKAEFEQVLQLEEYLLTAPPHDTLFYMVLDDDYAMRRQVYLPKFRTQPECVDSLLVLLPEAPNRPEQPEQSEQPKQIEKLELPKQLQQLDKSGRHPARPVRPRQPVERLQLLP